MSDQEIQSTVETLNVAKAILQQKGQNSVAAKLIQNQNNVGHVISAKRSRVFNDHIVDLSSQEFVSDENMGTMKTISNKKKREQKKRGEVRTKLH